MATKVRDWLEELEEKLGDSSFVTLRQLVDCGIYGSMSAARIALSEGRLPHIRTSCRRCVIPRQALIAFLRENFRGKTCR